MKQKLGPYTEIGGFSTTKACTPLFTPCLNFPDREMNTNVALLRTYLKDLPVSCSQTVFIYLENVYVKIYMENMSYVSTVKQAGNWDVQVFV